MYDAKYVVTNHDRLETIFMFPNYVPHIEFAERMQLPRGAILSAGFVRLELNAHGRPTVKTFGESIGLGVKSSPEDQRLAEMMFQVNG